jgi:hypothetical protein
MPYYLDAVLIGLVVVLALVALVDSIVKWYGFLIQKKPVTTSEAVPRDGGIKIPAGPCC